MTVLTFCTPLSAQSGGQPPLIVTDTLSETDFAGHLTAYRDTARDMTIAQAIATADAGEFARIDGHAPNFGYTKDVIWLRFDLANHATDTDEWRLQFRENFFQLFEVYQVAQSKEIRLLESLDANSPFSARDVPYPELVAGLDLPPGQQTTIYVRYWSGGSSEVSMSLHSRDGFTSFATWRTAKNFIYYGAMLFLSAAAIIAWIIARQFVFAAYACNILSGLLFIMHGDGNAFQYLWPNAPGFNGFASILLGAALILSASNFARHFLQTFTYHPIMERMLLSVIVLAFAMLASATVLDHQIIKKYLVLFATFSISLVAASGFVAARTRFREVRFYILAWTGALVSSSVMTMRHWFGWEISEDVQFDSMRIVLVLDAGFMGLAILDRINQMKQHRETALAQSLHQAQRNLDLSNRLQELERDYSLAVRLAQTRERHIADTIHDLRQPLAALQMNVRGLVTGGDDSGPKVGQVEDAFAYLEGLIGQELSAHRYETANQTAPAPPVTQETDMGQMLPRLHQMFVAEAEDKGLSLRYVPSTARLPLPPLDAMRLTSNLLANAIKYTQSGRVLFGLRHDQGALRLEVHDTGPGMAMDTFTAATQRGVQLDKANGQNGNGLGLSIVRELAQKYGAELGQLPRPNGGSSIFVRFPRK